MRISFALVLMVSFVLNVTPAQATDCNSLFAVYIKQASGLLDCDADPLTAADYGCQINDTADGCATRVLSRTQR